MKKNKSPLDLNELFPDYFKKSVFRLTILFIIFLAVFTTWSNGWETNFKYIHCPGDSNTPCEFLNETLTGTDMLNVSPLNIIYLQPGETIGNMPNEHFFKFKGRAYLIVVLGFVINHLLYFFRSGNFKPPLNKEKWEKVKEVVENADKNNIE